MSSWGISTEERRQKIIDVIDEEISELNQMVKTTGQKSGEELLRLAELNLEKARLIKERENQKYLSVSAKKRSKTNKASYFKTSERYFRKAKVLCVELTNKYPKYKHVADAYYIIAFYEKEAGSMKTASRYFNRSIKTARTTDAKTRTQIALAEVYYNQKKYKKAVPLYVKALSKTRDRWWTKDSFNLAWSYFRSNRYRKAIDKMQEVYKVSKSNKYVDMRDQVERDIGIFYAVSGRVSEGIRFYKKLGKDFVRRLLVIAATLKSEGQMARAMKVLNIAEKYEKDEKRLADVLVEKLVVGEVYGKVSQHLNAARKLLGLHKKGKTNDFHYEKLKYQAGLMGAKIQRQVAGKQYARLPKVRKRKAAEANAYFQILIDLGVNPQENQYFKGETNYIVGNYESAFDSYLKSFELAKEKGKRKAAFRSMDGMLAILASKRVKRSFKEKNYVKVYRMYLDFDPKSKRAEAIYQKLFRVHMDRKEFVEMERVMSSYAERYPKNAPIQEALISNYIDTATKAKKYNLIRFMVGDIGEGKYKVTPKFKTSLEKLLTSLQIKDVQDQMKKGNKKKALIGYHHILDDKYATNEAKTNATYNIATLYFSLADSENTYKWAQKSMKLLGPSGVHKYKSSFFAMSSFLIGKQEFGKSNQINRDLINQNCRWKGSKIKTSAFKNVSYILLSQEKYDELMKFIVDSSKCRIDKSAVDEIYLALMNHFIQEKRPRSAENTFYKLTHLNDKSTLIEAADDIAQLYKRDGNTAKYGQFKKVVQETYQKANKRKLDLVSLDIIAKDKVESLRPIKAQVLNSKLEFPQPKFDKTLQAKLKSLDKLTNEVRKVQKLGSGYGVVESLNLLYQTYEGLISQVDGFTPPGKSKEFVDSFKKAMASLTGPLSKTASSFKQEALNLANKNEILEYKTFEALKETHKGIAPRFWSSDYFLMDREVR
jgi:tetratricopeptide (TPR) repeat protein